MIKAIIAAFSIYSSIPVPHLEMGEKDMRYMMCFFPWIGAAIGVCLLIWRAICVRLDVSELSFTLICAAIPVVLTGGFHADGFMDTEDALSSYRTRERKLEILKDPHIGAFSVIRLLALTLVFISAVAEIRDERIFNIFCCVFFLSRAIGGIGAVSLPPAKSGGMLNYFKSTAEKNTVMIWLAIQAVLCAAFMLYQSVPGGGAVIFTSALSFFIYRRRCLREFGGVTGDTSGYFVVVCETASSVAAAVIDILVY